MSEGHAMPALFIGHGSPMNAIEDTPYSRAWKALGASLPRPRAILVVSAHWFTQGTRTTAQARPPTIHDFGNFPRALHEMQYPAPGDPALATEVAALLAPTPVRLDSTWGLDHGAWSILVHIYPQADIPVVQLSVDENKSAAEHFALGKQLAPLRERGVLVMATGNVVHNLQYIDFDRHGGFDWAQRFDDFVKHTLEAHDDAALIGYERNPDAAIAAPDPDHFLPIMYPAGIRRAGDPLQWIVDDDAVVMGSISMRAFKVG